MSMTRTIKRNIARENMTKQGIKHSHRKGYAVDPKNEIKISKACVRYASRDGCWAHYAIGRNYYPFGVKIV